MYIAIRNRIQYNLSTQCNQNITTKCDFRWKFKRMKLNFFFTEYISTITKGPAKFSLHKQGSKICLFFSFGNKRIFYNVPCWLMYKGIPSKCYWFAIHNEALSHACYKSWTSDSLIPPSMSLSFFLIVIWNKQNGNTTHTPCNGSNCLASIFCKQ